MRMSSTSQTELWALCLSKGQAWNAPIRLVSRWRLLRWCWLNPARVRLSSSSVGRSKPRAMRCGKGLDRCRFQLGIGTRTAVAGRVQGEALRQQLDQGRKRFALALLTQLQQQLTQLACVSPESTPRQGQQALESLTRESKGIEARGAGSRRRQQAVPRSIADRAVGLDQKGLGKCQECAMHSRSVAATRVPLLC